MGFSDHGEPDPLTSMETGFLNGDITFADSNNLDHCIKYLNQSLVTFGFPAALDLLSNSPASVVRSCNCIYALLQQRQRDIEFRDSSNDQRQRLLSDMARLEAKVERLEAQLSAKERELSALTRAEQKAAAATKAQIEKLQQERDEFQRMAIGNQQVRTQQIHEMKKKEKDYMKLQEKLNQVLMEKKKESKASMEILNLLQKEGRQRGTWNGKKADGDFYKMIVDAYEAKKQELMTENAELRAVLRTTQMEMRDFLNASSCASKNGGSNGISDIEPPPTPLGGRTDIFDLPFHMARDQIEQSLRVKMASIKERILELQDTQKSSEMACEASERELELEAQLVEARSIIQEQASIMSKHAIKKDNSRGVVGHLGVEREGILSSAEENRAVLQERTKELAAERSALRKMAIELDKERSEMDKAKLKYEEEQASWASTLKSWAPGRVNGVVFNSSEDLRQDAQNKRPLYRVPEGCVWFFYG
ncbi:hypothetical protein GOP47_0000939 [Adiantum capillus-veneris]|uniref:Afadin/alpha-actinin-binding protein n=1 Tax=Adiantum capillus-veneris TaxID=13818 RepID=A0A9D4VEW3_ADICA|nr:hypothetical protein GOP47_0000939 [Adiantum capillus-veneris]